MLIIRGLSFFLKEILFKYLFIVIKWIILKIGTLMMFIFNGVTNAIKYIGIGIFTLIKYIFIAIKYMIIYLYKLVYIVLKYIFIVVRTIFTYIFKGIKFFAINLFKGLKMFITYLFKGLKILFIDFLFKYIGILLKFIFNGLINVLKLLANIPMILLKGLKLLGKAIYKALTNFIAYLQKSIGNMLKKVFDSIRNAVKKTLTSIISLPKVIKEKFTIWFNNLSFIKDIKNKREMKRQALLIDFDAEAAARSENKVTYRFVAKNPNGKIEKGYLGAYSKLDVHSYLLSEGYEVYQIEPAKGFRLSRTISHKMRVSELVFFLTQLSTYIKSGIPLVDSIKILGKQAKSSGTKSLYKAIIYDLTMGENFSDALDKQSAAFPRLLVNMVKSSELAGNLSETLDDMAEYYSAISKTRKQMKSAMTYPAVIFVFATSVVVFLLTFVIPSFVDMYKQADADVPALTTTIIGLSDFLVNNSIFLIIGVVAFIVGFYFMYKNVKLFKTLVQWILMHMPVIGKIIIYNEVTMFSKTFASLWNHNVFITSSMEILSKITNNEIYKMLIFDAITNVARGEPVSASFKNHWAFPIVAYEMLVTGERTGQPGPMMDKVAEFYQEEHRNSVNAIKTFIEPALIVFLAVVVGIILLSVVLPMFDIYGQIGLQST
jgi:type IV pilus assembly protein PilC